MTALSGLARALAPDSAVVLAKRHWGGTHRCEDPDRTLRRLLKVAPEFGITRVANVTGLDRVGIPVSMVIRPAGRSLAVWQGKSTDLAAAKVSGLMEAIETACAEQLPRAAITAPPDEIARLNPGRRLARCLISARRPVGWLRGLDLMSCHGVYVPRVAVGLGADAPADGPSPPLGSNGLAAGNHPLEAVLQGVCELIERDAEALWYLQSTASQARSMVDGASVDDASCTDLLARFSAASIDVQIFDIATDIGVPAFLVMIDDANGPPPRLGRFSGSGCHPDPAIALCRALCEAAQSRLTHIVGAREDISAATYCLGEIAALLLPRHRCDAPVSFRRCPGFVSGDIAAEVRWVLKRLKASRIGSVAAVDISRAGTGVTVLRMVAPGLARQNNRSIHVPAARQAAVRRAGAE